jgi:hypothetical protein
MPATVMMTAESRASDPNRNMNVKTNAAIMQANNVNMFGFSSQTSLTASLVARRQTRLRMKVFASWLRVFARPYGPSGQMC